MNISDYIDKFPGQSRAKFRKQIAAELGVSSEAVRCWEVGVRKPRVEYVLKLEEITKGKVTRYDLRPDLFRKRKHEDQL